MNVAQQYSTTYYDISLNKRPASALARQPASVTARKTSVTLGNTFTSNPRSINESTYDASQLKNAQITDRSSGD
jgi:hypothetical protein